MGEEEDLNGFDRNDGQNTGQKPSSLDGLVFICLVFLVLVA